MINERGITVSDIIEKRKIRWNERHDSEYDKKLTELSADLILSDEKLRHEISDKPYLLIEAVFTVVDKHKHTVPFFFNEVQRDFIGKYEQYGTKNPFFILKGRQQGFTSLITAMQLSFAIVRKNFSGFTLADRHDNCLSIFNDKARMVYSRLPKILKPKEKYNSAKELFFEKLNSSWRIAAASADTGRSRTLNFVHFSEVAFYDCSLSDLQAGIGEAMTQDAFRIYETTANGWGESKALWDSGSCINLFYEWWRTNEYRCDEYSYIDNADSWLRERIGILSEKGLDREQICWYCRKYSSYLDKRLIRQEYPVTPEEAFISSGNCVFDKDALENRLIKLPKNCGRKGLFIYDRIFTDIKSSGEKIGEEVSITNIRFIEKSDGYITLHKEPEFIKNGNSVKHPPYMLGGDTAGLGNDSYTGKMINVITKESVATLKVAKIDEDIYAEQMLCLAKYYCSAMISVETNYSRQPLRIIEQKYSYANLYRRERLDRSTDELQTVCGFETTKKTKPIIIQNLVSIMRENPDIENDPETIRELLSFVRKENGSCEAVKGCHDDLVMALAIAHFCSGQSVQDYICDTLPESGFLQNNFKYGENSQLYIKW